MDTEIGERKLISIDNEVHRCCSTCISTDELTGISDIISGGKYGDEGGRHGERSSYCDEIGGICGHPPGGQAVK